MTRQQLGAWMVGGVVVVTLGILLFFGRKKPEQSGGNKPAASQTVTKTVYVKTGKEKRKFRFPESTGCFVVSPQSSWEHYVFGGTGEITIQHPSGQVDTVPPGGRWQPRGQLLVGPGRFYIYCRLTRTSADSVDIWAQWPTN